MGLRSTKTKSPEGKPIKLRTACNSCHHAKLRCSGEKSGCKRCRDLDHSCTYSESRVGKNPGNRSKRRHAMLDPLGNLRAAAQKPLPSHAAFHHHHPSSAAYGAYFPGSGGPPPPHHVVTADNSPVFDHALPYSAPPYLDPAGYAAAATSTPAMDFPGLHASYGLGIELPLGDTPPSSVSSEPLMRYPSHDGSEPYAAERLSAEPAFLPTSAGYFGGYEPTSQPQPPTSVPATPASDTDSVGTGVGAGHNSSNGTINGTINGNGNGSGNGSSSSALSACSQLVQFLDSRAGAAPASAPAAAPDDAVAAARTATADLARLLRLPTCRGSASCLLLLAVALGQTVALFEAGAHAAAAAAAGAAGGMDVDGGGGSIGSSGGDPRAVVHGAMLGHELRHAAAVLEALRAALADPLLGASLPIVPAPWAAEMGARLEALVAAVEGGGLGCWPFAR